MTWNGVHKGSRQIGCSVPVGLYEAVVAFGCDRGITHDGVDRVNVSEAVRELVRIGLWYSSGRRGRRVRRRR